MFGMGAPELLIVLLLVVLLFGASKIPQLGRSVGEGISSFKKGLKDAEREVADANAPLKPEVKVTDARRRETSEAGERREG